MLPLAPQPKIASIAGYRGSLTGFLFIICCIAVFRRFSSRGYIVGYSLPGVPSALWRYSNLQRPKYYSGVPCCPVLWPLIFMRTNRATSKAAVISLARLGGLHHNGNSVEVHTTFLLFCPFVSGTRKRVGAAPKTRSYFSGGDWNGGARTGRVRQQSRFAGLLSKDHAVTPYTTANETQRRAHLRQTETTDRNLRRTQTRKVDVTSPRRTAAAARKPLILGADANLTTHRDCEVGGPRTWKW